MAVIVHHLEAPMRAVYTGHEALTFGGYLDMETGKTLHAVPGGVYDVAPASGNAGPEVPGAWFTPLVFASGGVVAAPAAVAGEGAVPEPEPAPEPETVPEPEPETVAEPAPDETPETGEPQQF